MSLVFKATNKETGGQGEGGFWIADCGMRIAELISKF